MIATAILAGYRSHSFVYYSSFGGFEQELDSIYEGSGEAMVGGWMSTGSSLCWEIAEGKGVLGYESRVQSLYIVLFSRGVGIWQSNGLHGYSTTVDCISANHQVLQEQLQSMRLNNV